MCDCFHLAFPNWHAAPSGTAGRRLRAPEPATQDDSICEEPTQFAEGERPRPQGSSPVQEYPEAAKYADKECEEHDADLKAGSGHKGKRSGLGSIFERTSTPKMSKLKEVPSPEGGVIVNTAQDGCAEGLVYGGGGKEGIFIKKVVPESPASKSLKVKEGDQILSATVYFDNMSYEDAIQILEHAQAYKLKLCLKRQPDITEMESTIDSDVIPEEEVVSMDMREQGKTRRRGEARISWPKFPSFGKGRKSRFTRSHSSSEADEQRKLELSPTTSDTESPIKSQDALKGKKKHKIKLSGLTRRGRISSSEDQDTDAPTSGQMSSDVQQKQESDTLSPEINEQAGEVMESDPVQHNVELVSLDATLKTTDQTVALGDQDGQSGTPKSPDEKKKKKERSELKLKILGKDKSHKKDAKGKSSPKRLKTLGASVDMEDLPEAGKSAAISNSESKTKLLGDQSTVGIDNKSQGGESSKLISSKSITSQMSLPKVELDISVRKSPKKADEKTQKGKETKQKQPKKPSPKRKHPELDMSNVANAEEMQKVNNQEPTTVTGCISTTQLPKREDIEIPGMEDMSLEPKADFKERNKESQVETVQMSIDVDSVKEAVSKLPGFRLPQLDISGVPIQEEITVIDANAQRISVKTPTKVAKPKQEDHLTRSEAKASSEISKTIFLTDNRLDFKKSQMEDNTSPTKCKSKEEAKGKEFGTTNGKAATTEELKTSTRPKITMPSFGMSAKSRRLPYIGIDMQKTSFIQEKELTTETRKDERQTGEVICKVKIPELDGIEYIDSTDESVKKDGGLTSFNVSTDEKTIPAISLGSQETSDKPEDERTKLFKVGISPSGTPSGKEDISDEGMTKPLDRDGKSTFKWPNLDISVPKIKGTTVDIKTSKKDSADTGALAKGGRIPGGPESDTVLKSPDLNVPKEMAEAQKLQVEIKPAETQGEFDWEASKFAKFGIKTPKIKGPEFDLSSSKKEAHGKAAGKLPEASKTEVTPGKGNVHFLKQKMQLEKPGEAKPSQSKGEHVQGGKIKIPKFGVKTTKLTGPEITLSKTDAEVTLPGAKPEIKFVESSETDVNKDGFRPEEKKGLEKSDLKIKTVQKEGHKIKMPQLGIALPKVTMHESDLSLSKKGKDLTLPEVKGEIKDLEVEGTGSSIKLDVRGPGMKVETKDVEGSSSKFKMSPFKIPRFGAATPNLSGEVSEASSETHTLEDGPGIDATIPESDVKTKASEIDGRASKFKIPKFGISLPKLKGPEMDTTQSQKVDVDVTLFKGDTEVKLIDAEHEEPGIRLKSKIPQIGVQQDVEYSTSIPEITVPFSAAKAEVKLPQVDGEKINFSSPVVLNETPELEIPTMKADSQLDGQEEKMKLSKIGIKMPKMKGPDFQPGLSSKDTDVMEAEGKVDNKTKVEVPVPTADVSLGKAEILIPSGKVEVGKPEVQTQPTVEGQGGRFKMPKFGITMPKVKGPEAKKDVEVKLTETKTDIKIPDADFEAPDVEQSPSKFNMPTFKLPKLGLGTLSKNVEEDIDKDIPDEVLAVTIVAPSTDLSNIDVDAHFLESKTEVALSGDDLNKYSIEVETIPPQIKVSKKEKEGSPSKFMMPSFKMPKFGLSVQSSKAEVPPLDKDLKTGEGEITTFGEIISTSQEAPRIDVKAPPVALKTTETESEGKGRKFKLPSLGFSASQTKGPDTDISLPTTNVDISLPTTNVDISLPTTDVDITLPRTDVDVTGPDVKAEIKLPEENLSKSFEVETKTPEFKGTRKEREGSPSKFKMPTLKMPKFGLSVQSSTAQVPHLDKDLKTGEGEITTSGEILAGSLVATGIDIKAPSEAVKTTVTESEGKGRKFKLPSLGFSASQTKGPDTDISLPTTDVDITLPTTDVDITLPTTDVDITLPRTDVDVTGPDVKAEIKLPEENLSKSFEVETKAPEFKGTRKEREGSPSKFKMPTFKMPKFGLSVQSSTAEVPHLDKDLKLGEGEITTSGEILAESLEAPRMDIKAPSVDIKTTVTESEGIGRKFKLPSLGFSASQTKGPDTDISLPTTDVDISLPTTNVDISLPTTNVDITLPTTDVDITLPRTDVDVTGPDVKAEIKLPEENLSKSFEVETKAPEFKGTRKEREGSPSKFKMPTFKMPKFGLSVQSSTAEVPPLDKDLKLGEGEITTSGEILAESLEAPRIDIKAPSVDIKTTGTDNEGRGRKFKLPSLGFSASQTKGPDTDITLPTTDIEIALPRTDVDVTAPEVKAEIKLPEEKFNKSFEVETKSPEFKGTRKEREGSPSKFKMPTFKMPKFGLSVQSSTAEVPPLDKDLKTGEGEITTSGEILTASIEAPKTDIKVPSIDLKTTGTEKEGRERKFKLPSLGFSASQTKGPDSDIILPLTDVDIRLPTTDVDVTAPEVKAEIKPPEEKFNKSFEVETKAPEFKGTTKETEGSPSKFKMPTFKMPKFGLSVQSSKAEVPPLDKDLKTGEGEITTSGEIISTSLEAPTIDLKAPSVALKTTGTESEGIGRKFKLPSLGFSTSQTKGPDTDITLPTTDVDITVPEVKTEIKLPEEKFSKSFEVETIAPEFKGTRKEREGSPSKFKMPTFKMPKFGLSGVSSTADVPHLDKDLKIAGGEMSEEVIVVSTEGPSVEIGDLSIESKKEGSEREGKGKRFKLPSLGFSATQVKAPDTDLSLKTGVEITQPELKVEVKFPDDELKRIETEIETKGPEFQVGAKDIEGSTSKFKMPTFKLPKFGLATQSSTEEVSSFDKDVKIGGGETAGLEEVLTVTTEGPSIEIKRTSVDLSTEGSELEGRGKTFKLPSLSFSVPQAKEPETDVTLRTNVDVKVPEIKAEVKLPSNKSSVEVETKALETKDTKKTTEGSPSKFKMPNFKLPTFGLATQTSTGEVPPLDKGIKPVEGKITTSEEVIVVTTEAATIEIKGPLLELKTEGIDHEEKGKKFKLPSLGFSATEAKGTGIDLGLSKTEVDVTLPEVKAEVKLPDDENLIKTSAIEIKGPEIKTVSKDTDGSPSKFKMPAFKLPKLGLTTQSSTKEGPPLEKEEDGKPKNTVTATETEITVVSKDTDGSPSKFKMPTFKLPKFGLATQSSNKQVQDVKTVKGESTTLEEVLTVTTEEPSIKIQGPAVDLKTSETDDEKKGSKFKLPSLGFSLSQSTGPDTNINLPKADVDVTAPEVKAEVQFSDAKVKQPSVQMDVKFPEIKADIDTTSEVKMPKITLPTFGAITPHVSMEIPKMSKEKRGDVDLHVDVDPVDVNVKEGELKKYEVQLPSAEAKGEDMPTVELEGKVKRINWTFPSISFSRTGGKAAEVDVKMETPKVGVTSMETNFSDVDVQESSMIPALEATPTPELDSGLKKSKFSLPRFSFSKPSLKEPEVKAELPDHGIEVENYETDLTTEIKLFADEDKNISTAFEITPEAEVKSKKFKMPTLKMPRFGSASYEVTTETHISDKTAEDDGGQLGEGAAVIIKGPKIDVKSDAPKSEQPDQETLNTESDSAVQGSPSKFKLPTFKIPRLGLSRSKPGDESINFEHEMNEGQLEMKTEPKEENLSPKLALTSFGDILKSIDVDFDVRKADKVDQDIETSTESHEPSEPKTMHTVAKTKQDTTKSPESSSWFKFPKFGLSSPTEPQKIPDKAEQVKDSSPVGETKEEEVSPSLSVQSSDAFADVSSTITSEPVGPFIPSPTKVTVKYSDETAGARLEETHSDIMTSTTRTELIRDVPTLPEKITILSSGVSSSSEDTVRLTSGKIHIITSNIQSTPESQHAKILSAVQVQSGEGFALQSEGDEAPSWTVQDAQSATRTVKHFVQETSTERSENKETVVITKQITHIFGPTEPISGETASSIQRLKDSVHTEKMRFFDEAEK